MSEKRKLKTGHTVDDVSDEDFHRLSKIFPMCEGYARLNPGNWFVSKALPDVLDKIYDFEFKDDDVVVITYAKSGTTWTQEIVWTLLHNPDLNNPKANDSLDIRSPHLEADFLLAPAKVPKLQKGSALFDKLYAIDPKKAMGNFPVFHFTEYKESPRVIKSHLPLDLYPSTMLQHAKVVYVMRDPRDIIVSKYHFWRLLTPFSVQGTLDEFIDTFVAEEQFFHPYWHHVKGYQCNHPNVQLIYFEDMKADSFKEIKKISEFLGLNRTDKQIQNVVDYTAFKTMKKRSDDGTVDEPMSDGGRLTNKNVTEAKHGFFRKGQTGDWEQNFTDEQIQKINKWMDKNMQLFPENFRYKS